MAAIQRAVDRGGLTTYTISELASLSGVPPATIHHYLKLGLLPPAGRAASNRFMYDERHVLGLKLIRALRDRRRLHLAEIRGILPELLFLQEEAFRPEIWDRALAPVRRQHPSQRILASAKEAFARGGYGDVNVDDICEAAGVAKGSFYRHYRSKEELFLAAVKSVAEDVIGSFSQRAEPDGVSADDAATMLADAIGPGAPLLLELLTRSLQGRTSDAEMAGDLLRSASDSIGRSIRAGGSPRDRGRRAIGAALAMVLVAGLESSPVIPGEGEAARAASAGGPDPN